MITFFMADGSHSLILMPGLQFFFDGFIHEGNNPLGSPHCPLREGAGPLRVCIENRNFSTLISNEGVVSILDSHSVISPQQ